MEKKKIRKEEFKTEPLEIWAEYQKGVEYLTKEIRPDVIEVQGAFMQEIQGHPQGIRLMQRNDIGHPWVFGRLYCVPFLKQMGIGFSELRAMED